MNVNRTYHLISNIVNNVILYFLVDNVLNTKYYTSSQLKSLGMNDQNDQNSAQIMSVMIVKKDVIVKTHTKTLTKL